MLDLVSDFGDHLALLYRLLFFLILVEQLFIEVTLILALRVIDESYGVLRHPFLIHCFWSHTSNLLGLFLQDSFRLS